MNTKQQPGAFDVLAETKAAPEEPKFTLWGRDPLAPDLVREWAQKNRQRVFASTDWTPEKRKLELMQSAEAEEIAWSMDDFRKGRRGDEAPKVSTSYSGNALGAAELAAKERHDALAGGARAIDNAIAESLEVARRIRDHGFFDQAVEIEMAAASLRTCAEAIRPARPSYATTDIRS